jgi:hypothetical protein
MLSKIVFILMVISLVAIVLYKPYATSEPGAIPEDPAHEDLTRVEYPSLATIPWEPRFIRPQDTLEKMFGNDWVYVACFNRIDRRHVYPGMTIKVPKDMAQIRDYTPLPAFYEPAKHYEKYILIDQTEQWLGAYEYGRLKFSMPAATGMDGHNTPNGLFQVDARDKNHTSSLYKTEDQEEQYPMDNAIRFHVGADNVSYWIHARDLPGRPASHGCVGVYDEAMQNREYGIPEKPVLLNSEKLYNWAVGEDEYEEDSGETEELEDGPTVEVRGENPHYIKPSVFAFLGKKQ